MLLSGDLQISSAATRCPEGSQPPLVELRGWSSSSKIYTPIHNGSKSYISQPRSCGVCFTEHQCGAAVRTKQLTFPQ